MFLWWALSGNYGHPPPILRMVISEKKCLRKNLDGSDWVLSPAKQYEGPKIGYGITAGRMQALLGLDSSGSVMAEKRLAGDYERLTRNQRGFAVNMRQLTGHRQQLHIYN